MLSRLKGLESFRKDLIKFIRFNSTLPSNNADRIENEYDGARMSAWQVHSYGGLEELQFSKNVRMPIIATHNDVLVKVISSSINPIDVYMTDGYGNVVLNTIRQLQKCSLAQDVELPLIMGRDFAGEVVAKGNGVVNLKVGDMVYGVVPVHQQGCHAQNVVVHSQFVRRKPDNVTIEEAASLLYAALTAWSALRITGDLWLLPAETKKVLVIGGSGGVGTAAIQMLKSWGTEVTTTCSPDAIPLLESLDADHIIDYKKADFIYELKSHGNFDIILDAAGLPDEDVPQYMNLLKEWSLAKFITLRSPVLRNTDKMGLVPGMVQNAVDLVVPNLVSGAFSKGSTFRWAFFMPLPPAMDEINALVKSSKIRPVIQEKFSFSDLPAAYDKVKAGHLRGKVVVNVE